MTTVTAPSPPGRPSSPAVPGGRAGRSGRTLLTAVAPAVWGTTYIVTTELLPPDHPLTAGLVRALPAGLLVLLVTRVLPRGHWWWRIAALGTLNIGLFFPLLFLTAERLPGGVAATIGASQPLIVAVLAGVVLRERLSPWRVGWALAGAVGVAMVVLGPGAALDPVGVGAGIAAAASMSLGVVLTKRWGRPDGVGPLALAGWQLSAGGLVLLVPTLLAEDAPRLDGPALGGYLWLWLMGGLVAYTLWFAGIGRLPVTAAALLGLLSPLVATALGVLVLDERLTAVQVGGCAVALVAMVSGQLAPASRTRRGAEWGYRRGRRQGRRWGSRVLGAIDDTSSCPAAVGRQPVRRAVWPSG